MPDAWENAHRLDPKNDGYTNLEEYLNSLVPFLGS
jgi:hypothetical protein